MSSGTSIALVCLNARVHLALIPAPAMPANSGAICGIELPGDHTMAEVDRTDLADLHTFSICPACATAYLEAGHRERALAALPEQPALFAASPSRSRQRATAQLSLF